MTNITVGQLAKHLQQLCLTTFAKNYQELAKQCEIEKQNHVEYLQTLVDKEIEHRYQKRINHLLSKAKLPRTKTLNSFDYARVNGLSWSVVKELANGEFTERYENILIFGNPGTGKTHLAIALAQEWCLQGRKVFYTTAAQLIQNLLKAKIELKLNGFIKKLDYFEILIIDDISYIPCEKQEADVLFALLAARYEMRSVVITSNLPFAKWDLIFKDQMTATAAVDRLVHHSTVLELNAESYRMASAKKANSEAKAARDRKIDKEKNAVANEHKSIKNIKQKTEALSMNND